MAVCHGVDRKIPAFQIFPQIRRKFHGLRMSPIQIFPIDPVCRHLIAFSMLDDRHRAVLQSRIDRLSEDLLHLLRLCRGCDIPVPRDPSENGVPDTAADDKRLISVASYIVNDPFRLIRHLNSHWSGTSFFFIGNFISKLHKVLSVLPVTPNRCSKDRPGFSSYFASFPRIGISRFASTAARIHKIKSSPTVRRKQLINTSFQPTLTPRTKLLHT